MRYGLAAGLAAFVLAAALLAPQGTEAPVRPPAPDLVPDEISLPPVVPTGETGPGLNPAESAATAAEEAHLVRFLDAATGRKPHDDSSRSSNSRACC